MYNFSYFKAEDYEEVVAFMKAHPFITLCGTGKDGFPVATHIPVLLEEKNGKLYLLAHVTRKQDHTLAFEQNAQVLAIFSGNHAYISASWYETKNTVSTWNYQAVHAKGILKFLDEQALHQLLVKLTDTFEGNPHSPAAVQNQDEEYIARNMKAIIAFEIELTDIQHVFKLSQNKNEKTYDNIVAHLSNSNHTEDTSLAAIMAERKKKLFKE